MGLLDTVCIATNPGVTAFYGLAFAQGYGPNNVKPEYAILVRSNTNPESSTNITWTTISMFDSSKLAGYPNAAKGVDYSCAYNEQGVFTMFGRAERGSSSVTTKVPFGLRYDPNGSMDPSFNYQGTGAWMNLTVGEGHTWSGGFTRFSLGYVKTGATKVLVHASISDTNNVVSLATVNDSTGTLAVTALWTMNATTHGRTLLTVAITNDHLYTYGEGVSEHYRTYFTGFPLNTTTISPSTPVSTRYNTTLAADCYGSPKPIVYFLNETLLLLCPEKKPDVAYVGEVTIRLTIRDPNTAINQGIAQKGSATLIDMDFFVPIGDWRELGPSAFALVKNQGTIYACGIGNYKGFRYNHTASQVIVAESYGIDLNPPPPPAAPEPIILSTGRIIGIVVGTLVLAVCTFLLGRRTSDWSRKKKVKNKVFKANTNKSQSSRTLSNTNDDPQAQGQGNGTNYSHLEGKCSDSTYPERRRGSTYIPSFESTSIMPPYVQEQFKALQDQIRILQEQILARRLSSNPRPDLITTADSYSNEPATSTASDQDPEVTATPIPRTPTVEAATSAPTPPFAPPPICPAES
ncbi:hypothetical protein K457DRAFT_142703 [Linnemannia elongata AG-77]|uniref:Transmembrane protein n=1 Tax=Linnemannia elongata AG-77 TaxID=1314771 RepID=A0A197JEE3_9FUNG|nr:hypothetical protein K457DRAFT_142703 [Linnemannia elongata AG-77]